MRTSENSHAFSPRLVAAIETVNRARAAYQLANDRCLRFATLGASWNTMVNAEDERERLKAAYLAAIDEKIRIQLDERK